MQWACRRGFPKTDPSLEGSLVSDLPHCTPPPPQPSPAPPALGPCSQAGAGHCRPKIPGRLLGSHGEGYLLLCQDQPHLASQLFPHGAWASRSLTCQQLMSLFSVTLVPCLVPTLAVAGGEARPAQGVGLTRDRWRRGGTGNSLTVPSLQPWAPEGPQRSPVPTAPGLLLGPPLNQRDLVSPGNSPTCPLPGLEDHRGQLGTDSTGESLAYLL